MPILGSGWKIVPEKKAVYERALPKIFKGMNQETSNNKLDQQLKELNDAVLEFG